MEKLLKPGDPCPCCGMPIKTNDPDKLLVLNWLAWVIERKAANRGSLGGDGKEDWKEQ